MNKKSYKILDNDDIVWNDAAIQGKELSEIGIASGQIAKCLRDFRRKNNLTQTELAKRLEVSQVMVSKLERGDYNPTITQLLKISYKLTKSNKLFFNILKNISKSLKEDYIYNFEQVTKVNNKSTKTNNKKNTKRVKVA